MSSDRTEGQRDATTLFLRVLGPTALERDGTPLAIGGPRQRAVLARLALAEGRLLTVDRLVEDLWGEDAQSSILTTLHGYVSRLRSAIQDPTRLRREGPGYLLDIGSHEMDARSFERLAAQGRLLLTGEPVAALHHFDEALALWRGPAFADVADLNWAVAAATRLEELRLATMEARFDAMLDLGRHVAVVAAIEEALHGNPLRERFAAQLMLALYRSGRQADALRVFERTRLHLVDGLGLDPSPDLVKLESAILAHEPWLAARSGGPIPEPPTVAPAQAAPLPAPTDPPAAPATGGPVALPPAAKRHSDRPFVGRRSELSVLHDAWHRSLAGHRRVAIVEGEAGSGKSRLAAHFAAQAHAEGAIVLWGRATTEAIVPYEPLVEALRTVLRTVSAEARRRVVSGRRGLQMLMPFLNDVTEGVDGVDGVGGLPAELGADRYVLFETVAELLAAESAMWPIVYVLDDLQWADALSLRLLQHLLQHERPARLLVVGTVRTLPVTENPTLDAFVGDLRRDGLHTSIELGGLDEREVAELFDASGGHISPARVAAVHEATRGNPFFVTELAEHGDAATLPASVRDVLASRLGRISQSTSRLLSVAAVAGPSASLTLLTQATALDPDDFLDALDEAIAAGLLAEEDATGSITFRHALVQQVVLERLSRTRQRATHLTVADTLERLGASRLELAHHLLEAGPIAGIERTVMAAVAAGREALGLLAYEDALEWAQRALGVPGLSEAVPRCEVMLLRSDALRALGDRAEARVAALAAAEQARRLGDPLLLARAAEAVALVRSGLGFDFGTEDHGLDQLLVEALSGLPDTEVAQRARLLEASMANAGAEGDEAALRALSQEALELAQTHGQHSLVATAHLSSRMSNWQVDRLDVRLNAVRRGLEAATSSGHVHLQMNALLYGVSDLTEAGLFREATEWLDRFRELAGQVRQPVYDAFVGFMDATRGLLQGDYEGSAKLVDEALVRGLQSHGVNAEQAWAGHAYLRAWDRGELAGLTGIVEQAAARPPHLRIWRVALALCLIAAGRAEEARPVLQDMVTDGGVDHNPDSLWLAVCALLTEIARAVGDSARAAVLYRVMRPYSGRMIMTGLGRASLGPVDRALGVAAHVAGDLGEADRLLAAASEQCRAMGAVPHMARALWDRAAVLQQRDGEASSEAATLRIRATKLAERIGLVLGSLDVSPSH